MTTEQQYLINQMAKIIEMTVNNNPMTQENKEGYLTSSWNIIMKYVRECNEDA